MDLPRIIIAGTNSGVGKTTITLGIISALKKKGLTVQPFKTGPDYIDPGYHSEAAGRPSANLDSWLLSQEAILELFERRSTDADISVIEGVMGLYDGRGNSEDGSTGHLAKILNCPVILILDARSLSRSAAAVALGYREFDKEVDIAGIILNNIGSMNHYNYIKSAVERKTKIPVLGYLPKDNKLKLTERHLGLIPPGERKLSPDFSRRLLNLVSEHLNLSRIIKIGRQAKPLPSAKEIIFTPPLRAGAGFKKILPKGRVTIAVAKDEAFNFYYQDNLDILSHLGARITAFSPLRDKKLPDGIGGLYIGGGFPELFASSLAKNKKLKSLISQKAKQGLPIYAECGGLIYLCKTIIDFKKRKFPMVGIFKGTVSMGTRLHGLGYVEIRVIKDNILAKAGKRNRAHVFHWSHLGGIPEDSALAYKIIKGKDKIFHDGLIKGNVLAGYTHLHFASDLRFAKNFINRCLEFKEKNG